MTLQAFISSRDRQCILCSVLKPDILSELEEGYMSGVTISTLAEWLRYEKLQVAPLTTVRDRIKRHIEHVRDKTSISNAISHVSE